MERLGAAVRHALVYGGGNQTEEEISIDEDYPPLTLESAEDELLDEDSDYDESQFQSANSSEDED